MLFLPTAFIGSLGLVLAPNLARLLARGQTAQARQTVSRCQRMASILLFPLLAWLCAVGPELGAFLFHEPTVGRFILPMAVGVALNSHQSILSCVLNGAERQKTAAVNCLISDGVQLLFTAGTVQACGLSGYVFGYLVSSVLAVFLNHRSVAKTLGSARFGFFPALSAAPSAVLMGLCTHTLFHTLLKRGLSLFPALGICALFGAVFYLTALWVCGILPRGKGR